MNIFFLPSVATLCVFIMDKLCKEKMSPLRYVILFLMFLCVNFLIPNKVHAELSQSSRNEYFELSVHHAKRGWDYLNRVEQKSCFIPKIDERESLKSLIAALITAQPIKEMRTKAIAVIASQLCLYAQNVADEYWLMKTYLLWSEYHFEMADFYQDVLACDGACKEIPIQPPIPREAIVSYVIDDQYEDEEEET